MAITHTTIVTGTNDGTKQVSKNEWNANHTIAINTILPNPNIADNSDNTKDIQFTLSGATTAKTLTLISAHTDDRSITFPNVTGTIALAAELTDGTTITGLVNAQISASAAITFSRLEALTSAEIIVGNGSNVAAGVAITGDISITNAGVVAIATGAVVDGDLAGGVYGSITGIGAQSQTLDMSAQAIDNATNITLESTAIHTISFDRDEAVTDDTVIGKIDFRAHEDVGVTPVIGTYVSIIATVEDETATTEDASVKFNAYKAGTLATWLKYNDAGDATISLLENTSVTGTLAVSGILDTLDIETATVSARDGSLCATIADSTGIATFVTGTVLVAPVLGTVASGVISACTSTSMVMVTPVLGTPTSGTLTNCTMPANGITYDINAQTGTTYTFVLSDAGDVVTSSNGSAVLMTIPPNSSVAFPIGSSITVVSIGVGLTSVDEGAGVLINSTGADPDLPVLRAQHSSATFIKTATDTWQAVGDIA